MTNYSVEYFDLKKKIVEENYLKDPIYDLIKVEFVYESIPRIFASNVAGDTIYLKCTNLKEC